MHALEGVPRRGGSRLVAHAPKRRPHPSVLRFGCSDAFGRHLETHTRDTRHAQTQLAHHPYVTSVVHAQFNRTAPTPRFTRPLTRTRRISHAPCAPHGTTPRCAGGV